MMRTRRLQLTFVLVFSGLITSLVPRLALGASAVRVEVSPSQEIARLLASVDADGDKKITVHDLHTKGAKKARTQFSLRTKSGASLEVIGIYPLSNLLQELKLASDAGQGVVDAERVFENPVARISRSIRERYWDNLTRRVDGESLAQLLEDPKIPQGEFRHLYVPSTDQVGFDYFTRIAREKPELKVKVWKLPEVVDVEAYREIGARHGLLALALERREGGELRGVPFVVPGGRFNEMYGWDSYFEALGLLSDGRLDLAKAMVDNFVYQIEHYGKILNANRSYYLNRSQPPFLTSMISAVWEVLPKTPDDKRWLERALRAAIKEYETVWNHGDRRTASGLNCYYGSLHGIPPEVEKGHFDFVLKPAAKRHRLSQAELVKRYNSGRLRDDQLDEFFANDRAVRESGHDTTYRWRKNGRDLAADFATVDLNSLLYMYELDLARFTRDVFADSMAVPGREKPYSSAEWRARANRRKTLMLKLMWDPERKAFFDWDHIAGRRSDYWTATSFYPLWANDPKDPSTRILSEADSKAMVAALLKELELPGGLASTSRSSLEAHGDRTHPRQWEWPNGWAPHQMLAWSGLKTYGFTNERDRLIYKWLYTITRNAADFNGTVPEKFDVLKRSHAVFAEYGNVGTEFSYITQEGFGWMNASYQVGLRELSPSLRSKLEQLVPPEWVAF